MKLEPQVIFDWCKNNLGKSKYYKDYPKLSLNDVFEDGTAGQYYPKDNEMSINIETCRQYSEHFKLDYNFQLIRFIVHEYTHYIQGIDEDKQFIENEKLIEEYCGWDKYHSMKKHTDEYEKLMSYIWDNNKYEIEAVEYEQKYTPICYQELVGIILNEFDKVRELELESVE